MNALFKFKNGFWTCLERVTANRKDRGLWEQDCSSSVQLDILRVSAASEWDIKKNTRRQIPPSTSSHVLFCSLHKHTNDDFFDDFPKISDHFPMISEDSPKVVRRSDKRFQICFENFRRSDEVSIIQQHIKHFSRDYVTIEMVIFSLVKIRCYSHVWRYHVWFNSYYPMSYWSLLGKCSSRAQSWIPLSET